MKSTKVQTLGELRMCDTTNSLVVSRAESLARASYSSR